MKKQIVSQYTNKEGDVITRWKIGACSGADVEYNENADRSDEDRINLQHKKSITQKVDKTTRVERIKELLADKGATRESVKKKMYDEGMYKTSPNPPSAFAGDWNFIHNPK